MSEMLTCYSQLIEDGLTRLVPNTNDAYANVREAMVYSLKAGGKRIRPALVLEFCRVCGGFEQLAVNYACAVEMIHTYSLIHDDLPCMDDDDFRRGQPSCHKKFGEDIALLAGDALQPLAFSAVALSALPDKQNMRAIAFLAECCGLNGMVGGQVIDLNNECKKVDVSIVNLTHRLKTGALIRSACVLGCIAAGAYDKIPAAEKYADAIGSAFQIRDDILDVIGDQASLGKPIGSDAENEKNTYVTIYGLDRAQELVKEYTDIAISALNGFDGDTSRLKELALYLADRKS